MRVHRRAPFRANAEHVAEKAKAPVNLAIDRGLLLRGQDLNLRPSGYEPDELPDCSTPRRLKVVEDDGIEPPTPCL